jgi:hypothetical protein
MLTVFAFYAKDTQPQRDHIRLIRKTRPPGAIAYSQTTARSDRPPDSPARSDETIQPGFTRRRLGDRTERSQPHSCTMG